MTTARLQLGLLGEQLAERHLAARGFVITDRRWRSPFGEIDLVARERGEVVFIEVKTRRSDAFGAPEEAVNAAKRAKLRMGAIAYLQAHGLIGCRWRIDIAAVLLPARGQASMRYFRSAVGEEG